WRGERRVGLSDAREARVVPPGRSLPAGSLLRAGSEGEARALAEASAEALRPLSHAAGLGRSLRVCRQMSAEEFAAAVQRAGGGLEREPAVVRPLDAFS